MVYKRSLTAVIWNIVYSTFAVAFVFVLLGFLFEMKVAFTGAGAVAIFALVSVIRHITMKVVVQGNQLDIFIKNKEYHYDLDKIYIRAESRNRDVFTLRITDKDGVEEIFDLSLLGYVKYHQLLDDLAVTGKRDSVVKAEVLKK